MLGDGDVPNGVLRQAGAPKFCWLRITDHQEVALELLCSELGLMSGREWQRGPWPWPGSGCMTAADGCDSHGAGWLEVLQA